LALFLAVLGPGIITSNVDNDAGGLATYSLAGAEYGYSLIWTLVPIAILLFVVQEMAMRMGVVTGKGLSDLIRERFGVRVTFYLMGALVFLNLTNTWAEFAGIAASMSIFGVSKYISVPAAAMLVWLMVVKGSYKRVEKMFLVACLVYVSYIIAGVIVKPQWSEVLRGTLVPSLEWDVSALAMVVGLVGTTIAPWMQFYLQASVVEKGVKKTEYRMAYWDVVVGTVVVNVVAFFIIVACGATIFPAGIQIRDAADAAVALRPLAGEYASFLFAFGLLNASLFAASILPLSTSFTVSEAFGWEAGVNKKFAEAPGFYSLYTSIIGVGAAGVLWPHLPLFKVMYWSQVLNGIALPVVILLMLLLINDRRLMGDFVNNRLQNIIAVVVGALVSVATVAMIISSFSF